MVTKPDLERNIHGGTQRLYRFENGYGASVVRHSFSYGHNSGSWELAVIKFEGSDTLKFHLDYSTPITDDVIGHLSDADVESLLEDIKNLPKS